MKTRLVFCTPEQLETEHIVTIDGNGEFLLSCACGSFIKLPGDLKAKEIDALLETHRVENEGKITLEVLMKLEEEKLKNI